MPLFLTVACEQAGKLSAALKDCNIIPEECSKLFYGWKNGALKDLFFEDYLEASCETNQKVNVTTLLIPTSGVKNEACG